ncbi:hypothetical protein Tsubulata_045957 [Turnera subulata]|uniref:Uncharacterized protein n=1 Tax=Turnera subulata TaxID=218843 RepID=A0A9Q0EYR2_9ROSI|nr:hypothetical protein Tsubulata_045957 [Turnera subulata]
MLRLLLRLPLHHPPQIIVASSTTVGSSSFFTATRPPSNRLHHLSPSTYCRHRRTRNHRRLLPFPLSSTFFSYEEHKEEEPSERTCVGTCATVAW